MKEIAADADLVIVVGRRTRRTRCAWSRSRWRRARRTADLVDYAAEIEDAWLDGVTDGRRHQRRLGARDPGRGVLDWLAERGFADVEEVASAEESLLFALPPELRRDMKARPPRHDSAAAPTRIAEQSSLVVDRRPVASGAPGASDAKPATWCVAVQAPSA